MLFIAPSIKRPARIAWRQRSLGWPLLIQSAVFNVMFFIDSFTLGFVDERQLAAVAAAAQVLWLFESLVTSVSFASGALIGRLAGSGQDSHIRSVLGSSLRLSWIIAVCFGVVGFALAPFVSGLILSDQTTADLMASYLRIGFVAYALSAVSMVFETALQALREQRLVLSSYVVELCVKVIANILFVFVLGLDIWGVAASLVLAKATRFVILLLLERRHLPGPSRSATVPSHSRRLLTQSLPIAGSVIVWNVSTLLIASGFGNLGTVDFAAYSVLNSAMYLLLIPMEAASKSLNVLSTRLTGALEGKGVRLATRLTDAVVGVLIIAILLGGISAVYALLIGLLQPALSVDTRAAVTAIVAIFALQVVVKAATDGLTEGVLRPGFKNAFLFWLEVAALPFTFIAFHVAPVSLSSGFLYIAALEAFRLILVLARCLLWIRGIEK